VPGEAERQLLDDRRAGEALEDRRVGVSVALRTLLDDHDGDVEQRGRPGHPGDPLQRLRARLLGRDEPRLGVDDDEDALLAPDQRH